MKNQIKYLLLINSFFVFAGNLFAPFYALYIQKIDSAIYHIGGIWGFFIFASGIFTLNISKYENHKRYADYFLIAGFLFRALGWAGYLFATQLWHIYMIQVILALGEAFGTPSFNLIFSTHLTRGKIASEWGVNTAVSSFVVALSSISGGIMLQLFGFSSMFIVMICFALVSTVLAIIYRKELSS
ncbi:MAG: hypothetical protein NDI94_04225 [Candidatus Woesearchaeota archaeon]|nr:hypothetical protein [Candidatus Woesearchaeota archaeon]